jgi:4-alpha-glucanotransferase
MGLHRLYWVPKGFGATQGAYVRYPAEELYAILCLESHRHKTTLVGENLGTVPPEVNSAMDRHHLRRMYVAQYEQRADSKEALSKPSVQSVASLNTHDMPTFAAHWRGLDIADRCDLGVLGPREAREERRRRKEMNEALVAFLRRKRWLRGKTASTEAVLKACLSYLAASDAEIVLVTLEDLWQERLPQNVPATTDERPNWRRKFRLSLDEIQRSKRVRNILETIDALRKRKDGE